MNLAKLLSDAEDQVSRGQTRPAHAFLEEFRLKHAIEVGLNSESVECSYDDFMAEMEQDDEDCSGENNAKRK